jgi:coproporphyrinogen III oxidase-like Fe-S oxidoreductase
MQLTPMEGFTPAPVPGKKYLLYIHIPFCESLCPFCSFHRVRFDEERTRQYFAALRKEIRHYHNLGFDFDDIYVGGGTPTVLVDELSETLNLLRSLYDIKSISVETNPNHLQQPILDMLKSAGVTRLSVGVQSLDDTLLKEMGRYESYGSKDEIIEHLKLAQGQFDTFNVDMIFNIPHQTESSLRRDVQILTELAVDQISYYPLMPSELTERVMDKKMGHLDFNNERKFYNIIKESLLNNYEASSAWCFSRKHSAIDEYIVDHDEYLGIGSGSFSYLNNATYSTTFSINHYVSLVQNGISAITSGRKMSIREQAQYDFLMRLFGLRLDRQPMIDKYGPDCRRLLWKELFFFKLIGALKEREDMYLITERGMYYWVIMMREFFIGVNNFRSQMRAKVHDEWQVIERIDKS